MMDSPNQNSTISIQGAIDNTMAVMNAAGCSSLEACTNLGIATLKTASSAPSDFNYHIVDGVVLQATIHELAQRGSINKVPVQIGSNSEEALTLDFHDKIFNTAVAQCMFRGAGDSAKTAAPNSVTSATAIEEIYPVLYPDNNPQVFRFVTQGMYNCPTDAFARILAANGVPVWSYLWQRDVSCPFPADLFGFGAIHGSELPYAWLNPRVGGGVALGRTGDFAKPFCGGRTIPQADIELSQQMGILFAEFVHHHKHIASWAQFDSHKHGTSAVLDLGLDATAVNMVQGYAWGQCQAITKIGFNTNNIKNGVRTECLTNTSSY